MANPAAVYCADLGYEFAVVETADGQEGRCRFPGGEECAAWPFLTGQCGQAYSYCALHGWETATRADGADPFSPEYAVCVGDAGTVVGSVSRLAGLADKSAGAGCSLEGAGAAPGPGSAGPAGSDAVSLGATSLPESFDWRNNGGNWLTRVTFQGSCGSCWAFAAVGVVEAAANIAAGDPDLDLDLSEEYLVSGCSATGNCCGGRPDLTLAYIAESGVPDDACLPYVDGDVSSGCTCRGLTCDGNCTYNSGVACSDRRCSDRCADWAERRQYIASWGWVAPGANSIKAALLQRGPLAASMGMRVDYGGHWDGDIFRCSDDSSANHNVIIVGYNDAGRYWLVKESWGTDFNGTAGSGGYMKVGYGECAIESSVLYAIAPAQPAWALQAAMSVGRSRPAVAAVSGRVYVIGGESGRGSSEGTSLGSAILSEPVPGERGTPAFESVVEEYDPSSDTWRLRTAKPTGVSDAGAGVIDGVIYVPGGWNGFFAVSVLEAYDPATNTWSAKARLPAGVAGGAVAVVGSKLYVLGGWREGGGALDTCYVFDQPANAWSSCAPMPTARAWAGAAVVLGKIYVVGGRGDGSADLSVVERYDPSANTWTARAPMRESRGGVAAAGYADRVYACGGGFLGPYAATCEVYAPASNEWYPFATLNVGRRTGGLVEVGGRLFAEGGWDGSFLPANESLTLPAGPTYFAKTAPVDGAVGRPRTAILSWTAASGATSYEYCYDTLDDNVCSTWQSAGLSTHVVPDVLTGGATYFWQVRAVGASGTTYADGGAPDSWSFTVADSGWALLSPLSVARTL